METNRSHPSLKKLPNLILGALIRAYQLLLSPYLGSHCRYTSSCSHYALTCFERFGVIKATGLTLWRLLRCHPWCAGGFDPAPQMPRSLPAGLTMVDTQRPDAKSNKICHSKKGCSE